MKKITVFFVLFILSASYAISQDTLIKGGYKGCNVYEYEYKNWVLNLSVKSIAAQYTYDSVGHKIAEIRYGSDSTVTHKYNWKYDKNGNETEFNWSVRYRTGYDGGDGMGVYWQTISRKGANKKTHNTLGDLIESVEYDSLGNVVKKYKLTYDNKGRNIEKICYYVFRSDSDITTFKYDKTDHITKMILQNKKGSFKSEYVYDNMGNKTSEINYNADGSVMKKSIFTYDDNGKNTKTTECNAKGDTTKEYMYTYNDKGNITESITDFHNPSFWYDGTWKYDEYGNVTEMMTYRSNKEPRSKTEYIYFK
jgi:hypothetical protein